MDAHGLEVLREVVTRRAPALFPLLSGAASGTISDAEIDAFLDALSEELLESGLHTSDEPNERGLLLESLLNDINRVRIRRA